MEFTFVQKLNPNPVIKQIKRGHEQVNQSLSLSTSTGKDPIDNEEVFDLIRNIRDPEHPLTLEQLGVVNLDAVHVNEEKGLVKVYITPTIPHCSMISLIGLCVKIQLLRLLPEYMRIIVVLEKGSHYQEAAAPSKIKHPKVNKQLDDKERIAAAMENTHLIDVMNSCLSAAIQEQFPELTH